MAATEEWGRTWAGTSQERLGCGRRREGVEGKAQDIALDLARAMWKRWNARRVVRWCD